MRELNVSEIKEVNGGFRSWIASWLAGNTLNAGIEYAWDNREAAGKWAYNGGRHRRSMF